MDAYMAKYEEWLYPLHLSATPTTRYTGNGLKMAQFVSKEFDLPIWEHKEHPGYFIVDVEPPVKLDPNKDNWKKLTV